MKSTYQTFKSGIFIPFFFLLTILFCIGCKEKVEETEEFRVIKATPNDVQTYPLSEVFKAGSMVKLETLDTCLIGQIAQIEIKDGYFFINDSWKRILMFDTLGNFIKQIGRQGQGPGEYTNVSTMTVDGENDKILVCTWDKIYSYDYSGQHLGTTNLMTQTVSSMKIVGQNLFIMGSFFGRDQVDGKYPISSKLYKLDSKLELTDSMFLQQTNISIPVIFSTRNIPNYIFDLNKKAFVFKRSVLPEPVLRDTLYVIEEDSLTPTLKVDFSEVLKVDKSIDLGDALMSGNFNAQTLENIRNVDLQNIYRTKRYLFTEYSYNSGQDLLCYDLEDNKNMTMHAGFVDDFFHTDSVATVIPLDLNSNRFIFKKEGYELAGIIDGVDENSNPVIFTIIAKD